jgi:hypothetical protein
MAFLTVNSVVLPTPTDFQVGILDVSKAERNANGMMIIERITTKRKLQISYSFVTASDMSTILNATQPVYYDVTYFDPMTNAYRTSSFYCGDRDMGMIDFRNGVPRYKDLKFDLIER